MSLSKKILVSLLIFVGVIAVLFLYGYFNINRTSATYQMSGRIIEIKDNSVVITGSVRSSDSQETRHEERAVEFKVTSKTVLNNLAIHITEEQMRGGKKFSPENKLLSGSLSELVPGLKVKILSKDDLFSTDKAVASEINYTSYDIEFPQQ